VTTYVPAPIAAIVTWRARGRCEYCHAPQRVIGQPFHFDHWIPLSAGGRTTVENLCYACPHCNLAKAARTQSIDPRTGKNTRLFNPRTDVWDEHFRWSRDWKKLIGRTPEGRATVVALNMNDELLQRARPFWQTAGLIP
jgi:hypothetical protein